MNTITLSLGTFLQGNSYTYTIQKVLGQGSFGITYLATTCVKVFGALGELETTMQVAIKEFFMRDINGREENTVTSGSKGGIYANYKKKFAREAENLSKLKHPHIVKVLEYFEANNTVYYTMEYMEGGSLDDYIKQKNGLPEAEAIKYARQIGEALSYMHAHKMLHLDLKPGNVMLRKNGDAVLIDFGLSKQYDENGEPESSTTVGNGTPGYAPLEQANYQEKQDFPVTMDVYALGATLFKMLTGVRPPEASVVLNEGLPTEALQKASVGSSVLAWLSKAMCPKKKYRYQSIEEMIAALSQDENTSESTQIEDSPLPENEIEISAGITIFYADSKKHRVVMYDNLRVFSIDEKLWSVRDGKPYLNTSYMNELTRKSAVEVGPIAQSGLIDDMRQAEKIIIAYDARIDFFALLRYLMEQFGFLPKARYVKKTHLAAFYYGVSQISPNCDETIHITQGKQHCLISTYGGVVEIVDDWQGVPPVNEDWIITSDITLSNDGYHEMIGGVLTILAIWGKDKRLTPLVMLDNFPYDISAGVFADKQIMLVCRSSTIPSKKSVTLEKGYAPYLYVRMGDSLFKCSVDKVFDSCVRIEVTIDIDANGIPELELSSRETGQRRRIIIAELLSCCQTSC